jgi:hypothetical protein
MITYLTLSSDRLESKRNHWLEHGDEGASTLLGSPSASLQDDDNGSLAMQDDGSTSIAEAVALPALKPSISQPRHNSSMNNFKFAKGKKQFPVYDPESRQSMSIPKAFGLTKNSNSNNASNKIETEEF